MKEDAVSNLVPFDRENEEWRTVIETPKGSRNKYKFDDEIGTFSLSSVLPEGMSFPYDFGFLPRTLGADGDPLDVLLLMDAPAFCGCVVMSRLIGVIEAEQTEHEGEQERNDRLVAIPCDARNFKSTHSVKDLDAHLLEEIEQFFVSYNRIEGKKFKLLGLHGPGKAQTLAREGIDAYNKKHRSRSGLSGAKGNGNGKPHAKSTR